MWGVSSDPDAVSVKLSKSQTGSQTPSSLVGKRQNIKFSAEKEILFQSNSNLSVGALLLLRQCWKIDLTPKKSIFQTCLENWTKVTVGSQNFFLAPLATLLPTSLPTHPPTHPRLVMVPRVLPVPVCHPPLRGGDESLHLHKSWSGSYFILFGFSRLGPQPYKPTYLAQVVLGVGATDLKNLSMFTRIFTRFFLGQFGLSNHCFRTPFYFSSFFSLC